MTTPPALSPDEPLRLEALRRLRLVDTPLEERFERITRVAKHLLEVDIVAISLVESDRQFFKSIQGLAVCETGRDVSFCGHAILGDDLYIVQDARVHPMFKDNPLVTCPPNIVFYASLPLRMCDGSKIGTLCMIHSDEFEFTSEHENHLRDLASLAQAELRAATPNTVTQSLLEETGLRDRHELVDPLTRVWSRSGVLRHTDKALQEAGSPAASGVRTGLGIAVMEIHDLPGIIKMHGETVADQIRAEAAHRMLAALRESDILGRIDDDVFLSIIAPCDSIECAGAVAESARRRAEKHPVNTDAGEVTIHVNVGVRFVSSGQSTSSETIIADAMDLARTGVGHTQVPIERLLSGDDGDEIVLPRPRRRSIA